MIRERKIGERFYRFGYTYIVEAVEDESKPCEGCCFNYGDGSCYAKIKLTGFCYKGFRKDDRQVRFKLEKTFHDNCRELKLDFDVSACGGAACKKRFSCARFMLAVKATLTGGKKPIKYVKECKDFGSYMDYRKL